MALSTISGTTGITDATITSAKLADFTAAVDLNGVELILDADQDTTITADTDDRIDFKIAGVEHFSFSNSSGDSIIKPMVDTKDIIFQQYDGNKVFEINDGNYVGVGGNATAAGAIRIYEDTDNGSHYSGFTVGNLTASVTYALPNADGTSGFALTTDGSGTLSWSSVSSAADDISTGDAAVTLATSSGNITIDAQGGDTDIIFKGTDSSSDITALTLDMSDAGTAVFNHDIRIADDGQIGSASDADAMTISSSGVVTFSQNPVATLATAAQGNITSLGTLTTLTVDDITINGSTISDAGDFTLDVEGDINLDANGADIVFKDDGTSILTMSNSSTDFVMTVATQDKDFVIKGDDGGSAITPFTLDMSAGGDLFLTGGLIDLKNDGSAVSQIKFYCESSNAHAQTLIGAPHSQSATNTLTLPDGNNGVLLSTVSTATVTNKTLTSPVLNTATVGTSIVPASADGATLGTASVEFSDLFLADGGTVQLGNDQEVRIIHNADKGIILKHTATADDKPVSLTLQTGETDMAANDVMGAIDFQAPDEGTGTDAILVAAGIEAVAEGDFSSSSNATSLVFKTGASEAAAGKIKVTSAGHLFPMADDSYDLGGASNQWRNIYTGDLHLSNMSKDIGNIVDGSKGDWTIQEGSSDLFLINNNSGKKYKFNLTEV